ncbi:MAG: hypothetical protein LC772_01235, partial [Chloroflexi bacterium]|nr:hypothetical protein [Chloroflexota bacterium]
TNPFVLEERDLSYYDGPLAGWVHCRLCGRRFVFICLEIVWKALWHWELIPVDFDGQPGAAEIETPESVFARAQGTCDRWVSIIEDQRFGGASRFTGAWITVSPWDRRPTLITVYKRTG